MGETGIIRRYQQVKPMILFADSVVLYNEKEIDLTTRLTRVGEALKDVGLAQLVICRGPSVNVPSVKV
jgi:hypothetical protein